MFRRFLRVNFHRSYSENRDELKATESAKLSVDGPLSIALQDLKDHPVIFAKEVSQTRTYHQPRVKWGQFKAAREGSRLRSVGRT